MDKLNIISSGGISKIKGDITLLESIVIRVIGLSKSEVLLTIKEEELLIQTFFLPHLQAICEYFVSSKEREEEDGVKLSRIDVKSKLLSRALSREIDKTLEDNTQRLLDTKGHIPLDLSLIDRHMVWRPLKHQEIALRAHDIMLNKSTLRGIYIDGEVGSGKTALSLMIAIAQNPDHIIIVAPNVTIQDVWIKTLTTAGAFKEKQSYWEPRENKSFRGEKFIVVNFESIHKINTTIDSIGSNVVYIIDEAHGLSDTRTNIFNTVKRYIEVSQPKDIILMSGTPLKMEPKEIVPIMSLIDSAFTEHVRDTYERLFRGIPRALISLIPTTFARYRVMVRVKEEDRDEKLRPKPIESNISIKIKDHKDFLVSKIAKDMRKYIDKREKEMKDKLPELETRYILLRDEAISNSKLSSKDIKKYIKYVEKIREEAKGGYVFNVLDEIRFVNRIDRLHLEPTLYPEERKTFREVKTYYKYPKLKYMGEALGTIVTRARIDASLAMAKEIDIETYISMARKKTLIFSNYIEVAKLIMERITVKGLAIFGENAKDRTSLVNQLSKDDKIEYVSATYKALGTGIPIVSCSSIVALEKPFRDYLWTQAKGRIDREGQDGSTNIITFEMDTDEPNIYNATGKILELSLKNVLFMTSGENKDIDSLVLDLTKEAFHYELEDIYEDIDKDSSIHMEDSIEEGHLTLESLSPSMDLRDLMLLLKDSSLLTKRKTFVELFTIPLEDTDLSKQVKGKWEIHYEDSEGNILIYKTGNSTSIAPISLEQPLSLKKGDLSIIQGDIETTVGRFLLNFLLFEYGLNGKMSYINKQFSYNEIKKDIIKSLTSNMENKKDTDINLEDYKKLSTSISFIRSFSQLIVTASTKLTTSPPPKFFTFRDNLIKKLNKEHGDKWYNDNVLIIKYENEVMDYVKELFKDDVTMNISLYKKTLNAFKMKYVSIGITQDMDKAKPTSNTITSLSEGHQLDKESISALNNTIRYGSSARASSTVFAGVMTKHIVLAFQSFEISKGDCGTKKRFEMVLSKEYANAMYFLNFTHKGKVVPKDQKVINSLIGETVEVRLPHLCIKEGDVCCSVCAGDMLSLNPKGLPNAFISLSGKGMNFMLSKFHSVDYKLLDFDLKDIF